MAKPKKYYLIAHWCKARGGSRENPNYYCGPGCGYYPKTLEGIDPGRCYKSENAALRMCAKLCTRYWWADVVEVPESALVKFN